MAWSSLVLFDDSKLLLAEQFYLTDLSGQRGVEDLFDHDVGVVAFRKETELLCGCEGQEDGDLFLGPATEVLQTGACRVDSRHVDRVIRAVGRDAGLTGLRPEGSPGFLEPPPVVAGALGGETIGLLVFLVGLPASTVVVVGTTAVEADQGAGILLLLFVGGLGKDRRVDEVVVVVGNTEKEPETICGLRTRKSDVAPRKKGCLGGGGNK